MSRGLLAVGVVVCALGLATSLGCRGAETGDLPGVVEPSAAAEQSESAPLPPRPASPSLGAADDLGVFPAFMPPIAFGTEYQDCILGTDPYSTCI